MKRLETQIVEILQVLKTSPGRELIERRIRPMEEYEAAMREYIASLERTVIRLEKRVKGLKRKVPRVSMER